MPPSPGFTMDSSINLKPLKVLKGIKEPNGEVNDISIDGIIHKVFRTYCKTEHTDAYSHLNNAAFSLYFAQPANELLSAFGLNHTRLFSKKESVFLKKATYKFTTQVVGDEKLEVMAGFNPSDEQDFQYKVKSTLFAGSKKAAEANFKHFYGNAQKMFEKVSPWYYPFLFDKAREKMQKYLSLSDEKLRDNNLGLVVVEASFDNIKSLDPKEDVYIQTTLKKERNSFYMLHEMYQHGLAGKAKTKHALINIDEGKPLRLYNYVGKL
ncbi:MAG: thioesterase family protein [Candidatus Nanoarchaeia archaeon]